MPGRPLLLAALVATAACGPAPGGAAAAQGGGVTARALFAGGCFWSTEHAMEQVPGVVSAVSGFTGGTVADPTYRQVVAGGTGHVEAVLVTYDPSRIAYGALVRRFLRTIDPTDDGGQFCDRGYQYRSAIFVANARQRRIAEAAKAQAERALGAPVATLILPARNFYPAEDYHQDYYRRNPVRYRFYRWNCGRDRRIEQVWSRAR